MGVKKIFLTCLISTFGILSLQAQKTGVMIMAHGGSELWNNLVVKAAQPLTTNYPVAYAWGMADANTIQHAVHELEAKGVTNIIAIPLFISTHSFIIRQTEYLLGLRDSLADAPMPPMDHSSSSHGTHNITNSEHNSAHHDHGTMHKKFELSPLKIKAKIILTPALDDNDIVAQILNDRIAELSIEPANETVILVAHGPNDEDDNKQWVLNLESLSEKIQSLQKKNGIGYKQIFALTVRDDADKDIFDQAKEQLRSLVRQADHFGEVIVVPVFLSSGGREHAVKERLEGLTFKWNGKTLLPDNRLSDFLTNSVKDALKK